ncbi:hypothetical protein BV25DRAFT_1839802 [Artomyces pyxidatus]|uniref:Uncharacterized protein n=1 Tax=Artomyces pyxidatus TaxID=48021 RepID=A0ACB8SUK6_9AGAM|nr:hypothetical protein BV25DRAFT_1839802 [Artomyces pyxidatus]
MEGGRDTQMSVASDFSNVMAESAPADLSTIATGLGEASKAATSSVRVQSGVVPSRPRVDDCHLLTPQGIPAQLRDYNPLKPPPLADNSIVSTVMKAYLPLPEVALLEAQFISLDFDSLSHRHTVVTMFHSCLTLSFDKVGIDLTSPVFSHGDLFNSTQPYLACDAGRWNVFPTSPWFVSEGGASDVGRTPGSQAHAQPQRRCEATSLQVSLRDLPSVMLYNRISVTRRHANFDKLIRGGLYRGREQPYSGVLAPFSPVSACLYGYIRRDRCPVVRNDDQGMSSECGAGRVRQGPMEEGVQPVGGRRRSCAGNGTIDALVTNWSHRFTLSHILSNDLAEKLAAKSPRSVAAVERELGYRPGEGAWSRLLENIQEMESTACVRRNVGKNCTAGVRRVRRMGLGPADTAQPTDLFRAVSETIT